MKELDLHGTRHEEVERLLENFILLNEPPLKVITGNSTYMQSKLEMFCSKHKISYEILILGLTIICISNMFSFFVSFPISKPREYCVFSPVSPSLKYHLMLITKPF